MTSSRNAYMRQRLRSEDGAAALAQAMHELLLGLGETRGDGGDAAAEGATLGGLQERWGQREGGNDGDGEGVGKVGRREGSQGLVGVFWE